MKELTSIWKGSERTYAAVKRQLVENFSPEVVANYDPLKNCFTYAGWKQRGFLVKRGERCVLRTSTIIEKVDEKGNKKVYPKAVYLFAEPQVERISS